MSSCSDPLCGFWADIRSVRDIEDGLEQWASRYGIDWAIECSTAHECCWAAEVRLTLHPNDPTGPDRSFVTYSAGAEDPLAAISRAYGETVRWLTEHVELLPVREGADA